MKKKKEAKNTPRDITVIHGVCLRRAEPWHMRLHVHERESMHDLVPNRLTGELTSVCAWQGKEKISLENPS
jgi:hypothetical protein